MSEHKHTAGTWVKTTTSLPKEYEEVYAKHEDGSIRIARLSKSEGGCWQLATFLVDTKRPGYAWPVDKVVEWRPIQPATAVSAAASELLEACLAMIEWDDREKDYAVSFEKRMELCTQAFTKACAAIAKVTKQ